MHNVKQLKKIGAILYITFFLTSYHAHAGEAILSWNPPTTNADATPLIDLAGYKVYSGTGGQTYGSPVDVGNVTNYTVANLSEKITYYFSVTAYDISGNESGYSTEVSKTIPDTTPPAISGVTTTSITSTGAVITWTTVEVSTSQVEYGTAGAYDSSTSLGSATVTSHSVTLSGLSAWTTYNFRVKSQDAAGNLATSANFAFTTLAPPDITPPTGTISINNGALYTVSTSVTLTLSCNDSGTGCNQMQFSNDGNTWSALEVYTTSKVWLLSDGEGNKTVYVQYRDNAGNTSSSYADTVILDTIPPVISSVSISNITSTEATITRTTDEAATSQVEYGINTLYGGFSNLDNNLTTSHTVTLSGLTPNTVYYFRILSEDQAGNKNVSQGYNFTTLKVSQPDTPAAITDLRIRTGFSTRNSTTLDWTATGADGTEGTASMHDLRVSALKIIEDGITPSLDEINFSNATRITGVPTPKVTGTSESFQVDNLETNSAYYFAIKVRDEKGNISVISNVVNGDKSPPLPTTAIRQGYTVISFPLIPSTSDVQTLLGGIVGVPVELYWWNSGGLGDENGTFLSETNIVPGYGYFLKSNIENATLNIPGEIVADASRTIPLQPGWNMIGNPYPNSVMLRETYIRKIDTGELKSYEDAVIAGWVGNAIYNFNGSTYDYSLYTEAILKLWQGYWIAVLQNGQYEMLIYRP